MKTKDLIDQLEALLLNQETETTEESETNNTSTDEPQTAKTSIKDRFKKAFSLLLTFVIDLIKMPFVWFFNYFKQEVVTAIKKDIRTMLSMAAIMSILYLLFFIFWFSIAVLIGVFFYEKGFSLTNAILSSIAFQFLVFRSVEQPKTIRNIQT